MMVQKPGTTPLVPGRTNVEVMQARLDDVRDFSVRNMPTLPYHNVAHMYDCAEMAELLGRKAGLNQTERYLLVTAAYLHDVVYDRNRTDNEEKSAEMAAGILPWLGYTPAEIELVKSLIMATKLPTNPRTKLEMLICDADVANLGRVDFFDKTDKLGREQAIEDRLAWYRSVYRFVSGRDFYTEEAKRLWGKQREKNIIELQERIAILEQGEVARVAALERANS